LKRCSEATSQLGPRGLIKRAAGSHRTYRPFQTRPKERLARRHRAPYAVAGRDTHWEAPGARREFDPVSRPLVRPAQKPEERWRIQLWEHTFVTFGDALLLLEFADKEDNRFKPAASRWHARVVLEANLDLAVISMTASSQSGRRRDALRGCVSES
jgi:hypothetical protein